MQNLRKQLQGQCLYFRFQENEILCQIPLSTKRGRLTKKNMRSTRKCDNPTSGRRRRPDVMSSMLKFPIAFLKTH